jgi:hypothetical protein
MSRDDVAQLDPSPFERLLDTTALGGTLANERGSLARQLAQLALSAVWD